MFRMIVAAAALGCMLSAYGLGSAYGSEFHTGLRHEGELTRNQGSLICTRTGQTAQEMKPVFTPDKLREDLAGCSVGPVADVRVKTRAAFGNSSGSSTGISSVRVFVPLPMDVVFDQTNITDLKIQETRISGTTATLLVHVETISSSAGTLRLRYESVADEWVLTAIENISFKAR